MAVYQVRLINASLGLDCTIQVPDDQYILDMAEDAHIRLPSGCKQGECSACVAKLVSGKVDQSEQKFLPPNEIQAGYVVTCVTYPLSDCTLETHQEQVLYKSALYYKPESGKSERSLPDDIK
ncbi:MAG: 2Fe-2S iron-sulfur cluster-binding protein [Nostoc sp. DedQUE11]|nr:2Fe-2S iron-sulfur cluster-binding protein [Nostoc sp. DedQUE11]